MAFHEAISKLQIRSSSLKLVLLPGPYLADMTAKCLTMEILGSVRVERKDFLSIPQKAELQLCARGEGMFRVHQWLPLPLPHVSLKTGTPGPVSWLDIETTGLSPSTSHVTLVGCILPAAHGRELIQLFADAPEEEAEVLRSAFRVLDEAAAVITFNGRRFDVPYLLRRSEACSVQMRARSTVIFATTSMPWTPRGG